MTCPLPIRSCPPYANHADVLNAFENTCIAGGTISNVAISGGTISSAAMSGGTINSAVIGGVTPAAGTFSALSVVSNVGAVNLFINRPAGSVGQLVYTTSGSSRWVVYVDVSAEAGANAGSNFAIGRISDAAAYLGTPLLINRATGAITLEAQLTIGGVIDHNGTQIGFYGATPVAQGVMAAPTGTTSTATFDQSTVTLPQLAQRVAALINYLRSRGDLA